MGRCVCAVQRPVAPLVVTFFSGVAAPRKLTYEARLPSLVFRTLDRYLT